MTVLASYDSALAALAKALQATSVEQALASRDDLEHIRLRARQIRDRVLLADATEFQMRVERRLGALLAQAQQAGHLAGKGRPRSTAFAGAAPAAHGSGSGETLKPATLAEIGVDAKLSMKAQRAAAMGADDFEAAVGQMRERMASARAILVDPIAAAEKDADLASRRSAHAARTVNGGCVKDLHRMVREGRKFGSIGSDPQWKFLTRSAAGEGRSANVHYRTEEVDKIKNLPIGELLADDGAFYMWMVDWCPEDALGLLAHYGLQHITTAFTWVKTNGEGALDLWATSTWHMGQGYWTRANPEQCWFATKIDSKKKPRRLYADVRQLIVAPVMEHSRKPDAWLDRIERLTGGDYLELQARRPRPGWTSWGDELEWTGTPAVTRSVVGNAATQEETA